MNPFYLDNPCDSCVHADSEEVLGTPCENCIFVWYPLNPNHLDDHYVPKKGE